MKQIRPSIFLVFAILGVAILISCCKSIDSELSPNEEILIEFFVEDETGIPISEIEIKIQTQYWDWDGNAAFSTVKWMKTNQNGYANTYIERDQLMRIDNKASIGYSRRLSLSPDYFEIPNDILKYEDKSSSSVQIQKIIKPSAYLTVIKKDDSELSFTNMYNPLIECKVFQDVDSTRRSEFHLQDDTIINRLIIIPNNPIVIESIVREPYYPRTIFFSKKDTIILENSENHLRTIYY